MDETRAQQFTRYITLLEKNSYLDNCTQEERETKIAKARDYFEANVDRRPEELEAEKANN